jgi:2-dehydro-3-deoxyphosphogalactonate aldolase
MWCELFLESLRHAPLIAILRGVVPAEVLEQGQVIVDSGIRVIEVPLNSPEPFDSIARLHQQFSSDCIFGAGTVTSLAEVREVAKAGGQLIVSPHCDPEIIRAARDSGLICVPGVATPTEAFVALKAGASALKLFPAELIGVSALAAFRQVVPPATLMFPVGGLTPESMLAYAQAGANGFGLGSALYRPGQAVGETAAKAARFVKTWRSLAASLH